MKIIAVVPGGAATQWDLPGLQRSSVEVSEDDLALWMFWLDALPDIAWPDQSQVYVVDERPQWSSDQRVGVTRVSFLHRAAGLTRGEFGDHWRDVHAPLAKRHHPNVIRYVQNVVVDTLTPERPETSEIDGIAELSYLSVDDMEARQYDSDAGREIIVADIRRFIDLPAGWRTLVRAPVGGPDSNAF